MKGLSSILVGIDFTPGSRAALGEALRIASWNRASVRAVHVIDALVAEELEEAMAAFQEDVRDGLIADTKQAWLAFRSGIAGSEHVPIDVRIDHRVRGVLAGAKEARADLLVIGALGTSEPHVGIGTVATACVRTFPGKVLVVRDTQPGPFKTVLACVDFSATSRLALEQAASVATQDGAALHVVHAFHAPWRQLHYRAPTPEAAPHFQAQYRAGLERRLAAFVAELGRESEYLKPTLALVDVQEHRSGIAAYAAKVSADLIVLGTRGRTNLRDVLLGSTAEKVLRDSRCSVLTLKPAGFGDEAPGPTDTPGVQCRPPG